MFRHEREALALLEFVIRGVLRHGTIHSWIYTACDRLGILVTVGKSSFGGGSSARALRVRGRANQRRVLAAALIEY